jgi:hypothetical protein
MRNALIERWNWRS